MPRIATIALMAILTWFGLGHPRAGRKLPRLRHRLELEAPVGWDHPPVVVLNKVLKPRLELHAGSGSSTPRSLRS